MADARSAIHALAPAQCMWDPAVCSAFVKPEDMHLHLGTVHAVPTFGMSKVICRWSNNGGGACGERVQASSLRKHVTSQKHLDVAVKCYSCGHGYGRLDMLRDHLLGKVQTRRKRTNGDQR
ncbi:hypothetical protein R3P38DRAFT_2850539 [Favolaschia claudopus]|uniref:C2H2-type domain-containing protein n=1 Tax=Favolaschia claudopus TaxID=2862362 RepID=A0AAW0DY79_9AGAR